jgi:hypothetical protein
VKQTRGSDSSLSVLRFEMETERDTGEDPGEP